MNWSISFIIRLILFINNHRFRFIKINEIEVDTVIQWVHMVIKHKENHHNSNNQNSADSIILITITTIPLQQFTTIVQG